MENNVEYKKIQLYRKNIKFSTEKALLISMPEHSVYRNYTFWFPKSMVRPTNDKNVFAIIFSNEFVFSLRYLNDNHFTGDRIEINGDKFFEISSHYDLDGVRTIEKPKKQNHKKYNRNKRKKYNNKNNRNKNQKYNGKSKNKSKKQSKKKSRY